MADPLPAGNDVREQTGGWQRLDNVALAGLNTFGIAASAPQLYLIDDGHSLPALFTSGALSADSIAIGAGSNLLFAADPAGSLIQLRGTRMQMVEDAGERVRVRVQAGANWHALVLWSLQHGLSGLQNLALIPGTVGAAPIQNIGAYGVEVRESIHAVEAFDRQRGQPVRLDNAACAFAYRDSVFKQQPDRWVVTDVEFMLGRSGDIRTDYAGLGDELHAMGVRQPDAAQVAEAVIRIRRRKLPDPTVIGNAGSFFKNPIIAAAQAEALHAEHPALPVFPGNHPHQRKLSAAWLIEQCGWKGRRDGDAGVSPGHALVLVNHGRASGAQLLDLARRIAASVQDRFGVTIEPEPRIIGARW